MLLQFAFMSTPLSGRSQSALFPCLHANRCLDNRSHVTHIERSLPRPAAVTSRRLPPIPGTYCNQTCWRRLIIVDRGGTGFLDLGGPILEGVWGRKSPGRVQGQNSYWTVLERTDLVEIWQYFCEVSACQIGLLPSDRQSKLHWKFELTRLHYLILPAMLYGEEGVLLNVLLGFASISRMLWLWGSGCLEPVASAMPVSCTFY